MPRRAPCGEGSRVPCRLAEHSKRERPTGPGHPLVIVRCHSHGEFFTIYPPGFLPYSRQKMPTKPEETRKAPALKAARDAAEPAVPRWPDCPEWPGFFGWASTQWRHLGRLGRWLGLTAATALEAQRFATALQVPLHEHAKARERYQQGGYRRRGQAIMGVLEALAAAGQRFLTSLMRAVHLSGLYGRAFFANEHGRLRPAVPFR